MCEEKYVITPKGLAWLHLYDCGLIKEGDRRDEILFGLFWDRFVESMKDHGYVRGDDFDE